MNKTSTAKCAYCDETFTYEIRRGTRPRYCCPQHSWKASADRQRAKNQGATERWCSRCEAMKPASDFAGLTSPYCKPHMAEYQRDKRAADPDPGRSRREGLARYGLTPEQFDAKLAEQGGRCKICGTTEPSGRGKGPRGWHVDHDHACCNTRKRSCGKCFRGILCAHCNTGIGSLRDNPVIIRAALEYVLAYRARREGHLPLLEHPQNGGLQPESLPDAAIPAG